MTALGGQFVYAKRDDRPDVLGHDDPPVAMPWPQEPSRGSACFGRPAVLTCRGDVARGWDLELLMP